MLHFVKINYKCLISNQFFHKNHFDDGKWALNVHICSSSKFTFLARLPRFKIATCKFSYFFSWLQFEFNIEPASNDCQYCIVT